MTECAVRELEPATVASITLRAPYSRIPEAMGRIYGWLQGRGHQPSGMPLAVYFEDPASAGPEGALWEVRAPIEASADEYGPDVEGLAVKRIPAMRVATTIHQGPYDECTSAYERLTAWITEQGLQIVGPPMEAYLNDPADVPPEGILTEILFPVA